VGFGSAGWFGGRAFASATRALVDSVLGRAAWTGMVQEPLNGQVILCGEVSGPGTDCALRWVLPERRSDRLRAQLQVEAMAGFEPA
jgi:hypothetical protein